MLEIPQAPPLRMPGAILDTRLKVYDTLTPDGQLGGTPHVYLLCTEMYFVAEGSGFVEMIDWKGFTKVDLKLNSVLIFSPGTVHRLMVKTPGFCGALNRYFDPATLEIEGIVQQEKS